jgi:GNAT superfamily N-acetyltransferase
MSDQIRLRAFVPDDLPAVLRLFAEAYQRDPLSTEAYRHYFLDGNPFGPPMIEVAEQGGRIVGHYALCPAFTRVDEERVRSARSMTLMTHPELQGTGLFTRMAHSLHDRARDEFGIELVWAFPQQRTHYGFVRAQGWHHLCPLYFLDLADRADPAAMPTPIALNDAAPRWSATTRSTARIQPFFRDARWFEWRFIEHAYHVYEAVQCGPDLVAVLRTVTLGDGICTVNVVEWSGEPSMHGAVEALRMLQSWASATGAARIAIWCDARSVWFGAAEKLRATLRPIMTYAACLPLGTSVDIRWQDPSLWRLGMADSDVF